MKKFIIFIAFILLVLNVNIYLHCSNIEKEDPPLYRSYEDILFKSINYNYGNYVLTKRKANLYIKENNEFKKIGMVSENTYLIIDSSYNDDVSDIYIKITNTDYYISRLDAKKTEKMDNNIDNSYIPLYTAETKKSHMINSQTGSIELNEKQKIDILKNDDKYFFEFNNQIFNIDKNQVEELLVNDVATAKDIPVLNYHFFYYEEYGNYCNQLLCLSDKKFEEQLKYLKDNNFKTLTMQEFIDWYDGKIELPEKSVLITIDDGGMGTSFSDGNILIPLLEKYEINATLFLITVWWDKSDYKSDFLEIESHGYDIHREGECGDKRITCLTKDELREDFNTSIMLTGSNKAFCYPFYKSTPEAIEVIEELGFEVAFAGEYRNATRSDERYLISRVPIYDDMTFEDFKNIVN